MKSLFIPTSSRNFNNILSTESISPSGFYSKREFGYKKLHKVEANLVDNVLLAYSQMPFYQIEASDYEESAMILKVPIDSIDGENTVSYKHKGVKVYVLSKTIYLDPQSVEFLFFNAEDLRSTIIASERSLETKFFDLYKKTIKVSSRKDAFKWESKYLKEVNNTEALDAKEIAYDQKLNAIKGLYYGYLCGLKEGESQQYKHSAKLVKSFETLLDYISQEGFDKEKSSKQLDFLVGEADKLIKRVPFSPQQFAIANLRLTDLQDDVFSGSGARVFSQLANMLLEYPIKNVEDFKLTKVDVTFAMGSILKEHMEAWDGSKEQAYINALLDNLESYTEFDIKSHQSVLMQSIAAFVLKGEDPENLLQFVVDKEIGRPRIVLGLWGAVFGFASFPKTLFAQLFNAKNKKLAIEAYVHFAKMAEQKDLALWDWDPEFKITIPTQKVVTGKLDTQKKITKQPKKDSSLEQAATPAQEEMPKCPKCGSTMRLKEGAHGKFYGCSRYGWGKDSCNGTRPFQPKVENSEPVKREKSKSQSSNKTSNRVTKEELSNAILDSVPQGKCIKLKDLIPYVKEITGTTYSNKALIPFIKDNLSDKLELVKTKTRAQAVQLKDNELFN